MKPLRIDGERIRLRDFVSEDLPLYEKWLQPGQEWHRWDAPYMPEPDATWIRRHLDSVREGIATQDWEVPRWRVVIADKPTNRLVGAVARYWISEATHWSAVGIDIYDPSRWGKGIGFEALKLWCDYLFDAVPEFARLDLRTWSGNERMIKLAGKLGFKEEARFRKARVVDGEYYDGLAFGVLREEWPPSA
ncbi:MAG: GNAT family N-acetyltransferase [Planctomycetota bacterium]